MDDAERVRLGDRVARLQHAVDRRADGHRSLRFDEVPEVAALEVLHDHVRRARVERPDVEDAGDVVALEPHGGARLAREPLDEPRVLQPRRQHELEGDLLVELQVRGRDDDAHAADAEDAVDAVLAGEHLAGRHGDTARPRALGAVHRPAQDDSTFSSGRYLGRQALART